MRTRVLVAVMTLAALACAAAVVWEAVLLLRDGRTVPVVFGVALLVLPLVGAFTIVTELRFGAASGRLARTLEAEGGLPVDDLPRTPSGRVVRADADAGFDRWQAETAAAPADWRTWYRLALAYDAARDRKRARAAVRRAIALYPGVADRVAPDPHTADPHTADPHESDPGVRV